jgi:hypothetical protein
VWGVTVESDNEVLDEKSEEEGKWFLNRNGEIEKLNAEGNEESNFSWKLFSYGTGNIEDKFNKEISFSLWGAIGKNDELYIFKSTTSENGYLSDSINSIPVTL